MIFAQSLGRKRKRKMYLTCEVCHSESVATFQYLTPPGFSATVFNAEAGYHQISKITPQYCTFCPKGGKKKILPSKHTQTLIHLITVRL